MDGNELKRTSARKLPKLRRMARGLAMLAIAASPALPQGVLAGAATSATAAPSVTSVSPDAGPTAGGTTVTITGSGFDGVVAVQFGSNAAASYTIVNAHILEAVSPPMPAETVQLTVTTSSGSSSPSSKSDFSYLPIPNVAGVSPSSGAVTGGNTVTIAGSGFTDATEVAFGQATTTDFTVWSDTKITTFAPPGPVGTVAVTVITAGGTSTAATGADKFSYFAGANPGYHVSGNRVLAPSGAIFTPRGSVVPCLAYVPLNDAASHTNCGTNARATNVANIEALGTAWHADDVRIQVAQETLFDESPYNTSYLATVDSEVQLANSLGMVATISLQEEVAPDGPVFPVASSVTFWNFVAQHFENNPMVMFDLFNEPHLSPYSLSHTQTLWEVWRNGGFVDDLNAKECTGPAQQCIATTFIGMQTLLTDIRDAGVSNIVIAEGIHDDQNLTGIPEYALDGSNLVYGIEPNLYTTTTEADWVADYGTLTQTYPVFGESLVVFDASALCNASAPTLLPAEFQYMQSIGMGSLVWGMVPGDLIAKTPSVPTTYDGVSTVTCTSPDPGVLPGPPEPTNTTGPGADTLAFFESEATGQLLANPVIDSVSSPSGGQVTIAGHNFANTADVTFGGINAPSFATISPTQVQATIPAPGEGSTIEVLTTSGSANVTVPSAPSGVSVESGNGTVTASFDSVPGVYSYTVTAADQTNPANPVQSAEGASSPITVTGLTDGDSYLIAVSACNGISTGPSTVVDGVVPGSVPGAPTIVSVTPGRGQATVTFTPPPGDGESPITSYTVTAADQTNPANPVQSAEGASSPITVTGLTDGDSYTITVSATNNVGTGPTSLPVSGVVPLDPVAIALLTPSALPQASTTEVVVKGQGFVPGMTLTVSGSGVKVLGITVESGTAAEAKIKVSATTSPGPRSVQAMDSLGSATCDDCLTVDPLPKVRSLSPASIAAGAVGTVKVKGANFQPGATVFIGSGIIASVTGIMTTSLTLRVSVPESTPDGSYSLTVVNPDGGKGSCVKCFSVITAPTVQAISPSVVSPGEQTSVTISGSGFASGMKITGPVGSTFSKVDVENSTTATALLQVAATAAPLDDGPVTVTNSNAGGDGTDTKALLTVS